MTFRHLAILSSVLLFGLSAVWMSAPELMLTQWGVQYSDGAGLVSRRAAAFYAGIALMLLLARNTEASKARFALATGISLTCLILTTLGIFEWQSGSATAQVLGAVVLEAVLAVAFLLSNKAKS
jgi:peptidoglycan/LPS O-acetylase OafA/YrhL